MIFGSIILFYYLCIIMNEEDVPNWNEMSLGELQEIITQEEDALSRLDKRTSRYKIAVSNLNILFEVYNKKHGEKIYKLIKQ